MHKSAMIVLPIMFGVLLGAAIVEALHFWSSLTFDRVIAYLDKRHDVVTAGAAVLALLVSLISILFTVGSMAMQRGHNRKSVLPIGHISVGDYEDDIFVRLRNDGIGPMIVDKVSVNTKGNDEPQDALIDCLPDGITWSTFVANISGRAISPEQYVTLVRLQGDSDDPEFSKVKQSVRRALSVLTVTVEYKNIYDERMLPARRDLSWFGR